MSVVLAIDVGGTFVKAALINADSTIVDICREPTRPDDPGTALAAVHAAATVLLGRASGLGLSVTGVGIVVPGIVDDASGVAIRSANLGWRDVAVRGVVAAQLGLPVVLGHDVRAGALAEAVLGAGRGASSVLFIAVGTGLSAAHVVDGRIHPGARFAAGEIGHLPIGVMPTATATSGSTSGHRCGCGAIGCLETVASAAAVARRYRERTGRDATAEQIAGYAARGETDAAVVWQETIDALAAGLAIAITVIDPELVVIGGGLSLANEGLLGPLRAGLSQRLRVHPVPRLAVARLGDLAGCHGAGLLALAAATANPTANPTAPNVEHVISDDSDGDS